MFRSTARSLRSWWSDFSDDILGADLPPSVYDEDLAYRLAHPHRRPLRMSRPRREGTVAPRLPDCLSPVRAQDLTAATAARLVASRHLAG
jgi:hypothetical protein